jgi:oligoribonuclease NrnB/cAMP/cGMP phosphodiesterase (DHH superfamily)
MNDALDSAVLAAGLYWLGGKNHAAGDRTKSDNFNKIRDRMTRSKMIISKMI